MDQNIEKKKNLREEAISFLKEKKVLLISLIAFTLTLIIFFISLNIYKETINSKISEKYIKAGIYLASKNEKKSKELLEEIILSKNKFYSPLSLNILIEKNLVEDKKKILEYFELIENLKLSKEKKNLIHLKKSLFLIENLEVEKGKDLLNKLIQSETNFKSIAEEIYFD